jgi:hypothetical protein
MQLESLQKRRRDVVQAYVSTGDLNFWREVREVSESIVMLRELEERAATGPASSDEAIEGLMVVEQ